ncbi:MAG: replication factor C large subunit [Candidatus Bathyarchaeota archaeon]|nr:replication factor C large subunit [Candidatus Bathyarchaeota archaeon]
MRANLLWVEKYRPQKISDVIGNEQAKNTFVNWLKSKRRRKKAVLLYGPAGVGKTALVNAVSNQFNFAIVEMNASDTRTKKAINKVGKPATSYIALNKFSTETKGNILFLDEVDGVFGQQDRGGIGAILKIIKESLVPVVMAANDPDLKKLRPLKKVCHLIRFQQLRIPLIITILRRICVRENIEAEFEALERIAQNSQGDMRSAINDLQSIAEGRRVLRLQDTMFLSFRNKDVGMYETLKGVFSAESVGEAANLLNRSSVKYDEILLSMSDNLPLRYLDSLELANAYDLVSRADIFRGRVGTENWRLLRYFFNLLAEASTVSPKSFKPFEFIYPPIRVMKLFWTKNKRLKMESICAKIALKCHVSRRTAKKDIVPFLKIILKKQKSSPIISWLKLESDEVDYLTKMNKF